MLLDASLLNTQYYKVRIKGKLSNKKLSERKKSKFLYKSAI